MVTYTEPVQDRAHQHSVIEWGGAHSDPSLRSSRQLIIVGRGRSILSSGVATDKVPMLL